MRKILNVDKYERTWAKIKSVGDIIHWEDSECGIQVKNEEGNALEKPLDWTRREMPFNTNIVVPW